MYVFALISPNTSEILIRIGGALLRQRLRGTGLHISITQSHVSENAVTALYIELKLWSSCQGESHI